MELEQKNVEKMRMLTGQMLGQCKSIDKLDIDYWLDEMEKMEKEGVDFVDLCKLDIHRKKKMGAIAVVTGTLVALTNRIKEIERGEEDEAAKY